MSLRGVATAVFLRAYGTGPWPCGHCGDLVEAIDGRVDSDVVHHIDHDRTNNDPSNLVAMHRTCHATHHHAAVEKSPEHRRRISEALNGRQLSEAHKESIAAAAKHRAPISDETKEKMRRSALGKSLSESHKEKLRRPKSNKVPCHVCGRIMCAGWLARHIPKEHGPL